jgi:exosortase/archaeosortase family protein
LSRVRLFGWLYAVLALNGAVTLAAAAVRDGGWALASLNLFGISAIVWVAAAAALELLFGEGAEDSPVRGADRLMAGLATACALVPLPALSAIALTGVAARGAANAAPGSRLRRASFIFLSITAFLIWGRMLLAAASGPLLALDVAISSLASGTSGHGNMMAFAGTGRSFMVAPGCSTLHGISLALVLWTAITQYCRLPVGSRALASLGAAIVAAVMVNTGRLAMLARHPASFDYWHIGGGAALFGWIGLVAIAGTLYFGLRREISRSG